MESCWQVDDGAGWLDAHRLRVRPCLAEEKAEVLRAVAEEEVRRLRISRSQVANLLMGSLMRAQDAMHMGALEVRRAHRHTSQHKAITLSTAAPTTRAATLASAARCRRERRAHRASAAAPCRLAIKVGGEVAVSPPPADGATTSFAWLVQRCDVREKRRVDRRLLHALAVRRRRLRAAQRRHGAAKRRSVARAVGYRAAALAAWPLTLAPFFLRGATGETPSN